MTVNYRIDDNPIRSQFWNVGSDRKSTFVPIRDLDESIRGLYDSETFTVMVHQSTGDSPLAVFDTRGFREAITLLLDESDIRRNPPPSSAYPFQSSTGNAARGGYPSGRPTSSTPPRFSQPSSPSPDSRYESEDTGNSGCGVIAGSLIATIVATGLVALIGGLCAVALG